MRLNYSVILILFICITGKAQYVSKLQPKSPFTNDELTHDLITVSHFTSDVHSGTAHYVKGYVDLSAGDSTWFCFKVPCSDTLPHASWTISGTQETIFKIREDNIILIDSSTVVTPFNHNRNKPDNACVKVYAEPTYIGNGQVVYSSKLGSGNKTGGSESAKNEFIGRGQTKYIFILINSSSKISTIDYYITWTEHY